MGVVDLYQGVGGGKGGAYYLIVVVFLLALLYFVLLSPLSLVLREKTMVAVVSFSLFVICFLCL